MTNKFNNWERLAKVIERFGLTINSFAKVLGLNRSETLYHIRKGDFGISADLADRIVKIDKDIDRTWLLSGIGNMLHSDATNGEYLPFYRKEMEVVLRDIDTCPSDGEFYVPYVTGCNYIVRSFSRSMSDAVTAATDLFLKRLTNIDDVVQGNEYVLRVGDEIIWRRVRFIKSDDKRWRLVSNNRVDFPDVYVNIEDISDVWRVISRIAVLES
mgnify:FL=1